MTIVIGGEEVTIGRVADHPHIYPVAAAYVARNDRRRATIESFGRTPALWITDVGVRGISGVTVLVNKIPNTLGGEVEDLGCGAISGADTRLVKVVLVSGGSLGKVSEIQVDEAVPGFLCCAREDVIDAIVINYRWVLDAGDIARIRFWRD